MSPSADGKPQADDIRAQPGHFISISNGTGGHHKIVACEVEECPETWPVAGWGRPRQVKCRFHRDARPREYDDITSMLIERDLSKEAP